MNKMKEKGKLVLVFALAIIVVFFFIICRFGFFVSDDYGAWIGGSCTLIDVLLKTKTFYLNWGGGVFSTFLQYLFCGLFVNNKLWFDIANTFVFGCMMLISYKLICLKLITRNEKIALAFVLLFWFLCPIPRETLFWVVGSTGYLWSNTLVFLFLLVFMKNKDSDSQVLKKMLLLFLSAFCAASIIPCVSICGAFVVYYLFHFDKFKGNAIFLVSGFCIWIAGFTVCSW